MKIGIEARKLFSPDKHGMDVVALELVRNAPLLAPDLEFIVFAQKGTDRIELPKARNLSIVELPKSSVPIWEQIVLPMAASKHKCSILHCTSNTGPILSKAKLVITLHDISYLENARAIKNASSIYHKLKSRYRRFVVPQIVDKAAKIITVSKYQEKIIQSFFGFRASLITTIYNGASSHFSNTCDTTKAAEIREKFMLPGSFILFLGSDDPKKNTSRVLAAYKHFVQMSAKRVPLVIVDISEKKLGRLLAELKADDIRDHIILTGYVPNSTLPYLYSFASLFLYPSMKESFGIPILEAMSCRTPVITSNTSSMPEIAENAAFIVDPFDTMAMAKAMTQIFEHEMLRDGLIKKGLEQAVKFSFPKMAGEVCNVYREVLANQ
jgi:glycosyltransferase involved in cell wall biosynthesis